MNKYQLGVLSKNVHVNVKTLALSAFATLAIAGAAATVTAFTHASGTSSSQPQSIQPVASAPAPVVTTTPTNPAVDTIQVSKCFTVATATTPGSMLIKAVSSDNKAILSAYSPDGTFLGQVQNGGGSKYGGTVMQVQITDPGTVTITSSEGGSVTVPTTPFQI